MKIKDALKLIENYLLQYDVSEARLKARIILTNAISRPREYLITHEDVEISDATMSKIFEKVMSLRDGTPVQYVTNHQEFYGLDFYVDENVLIPQPDTEILVEEADGAIEKLVDELWNKRTDFDNVKQVKILDLCTGSGIIAIYLKKKFGDSILAYASDISEEALCVAKRNAKSNETPVNFIKSNLFENIEEKGFDFIISNPPYVCSDVIKTLSVEVQKEPHIALDGGKDGLDFYKKIAKESKAYLNKGGYLMLEIGFDQKDRVIEILNENGYSDIYSKKDYSGNDRIVVGKRG